MWKLFKRKKEKKENQWSLATKALNGLLIVQRRWAIWMGKRSAKWTKRQTTIYLVLFCLVFSGVSVLILVDTFFSKPRPSPVTVQSMPTLPVMRPDPEIRVTDSDIAVIQQFNLYLDSLQTTKEGLQQYQELARDRPGLIDSLLEMKKFFTK
jgi:hypothetical protein